AASCSAVWRAPGSARGTKIVSPAAIATGAESGGWVTESGAGMTLAAGPRAAAAAAAGAPARSAPARSAVARPTQARTPPLATGALPLSGLAFAPGRRGCVLAADPGVEHLDVVIHEHQVGAVAWRDTAHDVAEAQELRRVAAGHPRGLGQVQAQQPHGVAHGA